ncbi:MAG: UbiD family decarboxylase, partial [Ancalomicrobiaceae bacterium]|nr:UbiD family decarboxylase [Ancalomicrobiaceae bacterium]
MYRRLLPHFGDLAAFLAFLERKGEVKRIAQPVDMRLEATEIHRRVIAEGGPVLRFDAAETAAGRSPMPVITNLFGTRERVAAGLGADVAGLEALGEFLASLRSPRPPASLSEATGMLPIARAALNARPKIGRDAAPWPAVSPDLSALPVQTCWPGDAGPLITWGIVITRPPGADDPASYNLGVYRL